MDKKDSYSQYGEDVIVRGLLGDTTAKLLDVGAWDPIDKSNSRLLIEQGWMAVLVEPSPGPLRALVAEYESNPRVEVIGAVVAEKPGLVWLNVTDDAVSSSDAAVQETWAEAGGYYGGMHVPAVTFPEIWNQFGGFDYVDIDAEGNSVNLACLYLRLGGRPKVFLVEHDNRVAELMACFQGYGYKLVHMNGTNAILAN